MGNVPFTPHSKKVLELAINEAKIMGNNYISSEHILFGLIKEGESIAARILARHGVTLDRAKKEITNIFKGVA